MPPLPSTAKARYGALSSALVAATALLVVLTFADYGITYDEEVQHTYGKHVVAWYASLFADRSALAYFNLNYYGGLFDAVAVLLSAVSPFGEYETRHLLNGLVGVVGVAGAIRLGRLLGGPRAGFLAGLLLAVTPLWYGHMFNNPKDIPFAAAMLWTLYYFARVAHRLPDVPPGLTVKLGLALGAALGTRIGGVIAFIYFAALIGAFLAWRFVETRDVRAVAGDARSILARLVLPTTATAWAIMLIAWPWAQLSPLLNPFRAVAYFSNFAWYGDNLFDGEFVLSTEAPWTYLPTYLVLQLPEPIVLLALAAPLIAAWNLRAARRNRIGEPPGPADRGKTIGLFLLVFTIAFPLLYAVVRRPVVYDGIRHFLFMIPSIVVLAALVLDRLLDALRRISRRLGWLTPRAAALGAGGVWMAWHLWVMGVLHPDQYVYYNLFVGGLPGAYNRFETDYWGNSFAEAVELMVARVRAEQGANFTKTRYKVISCGNNLSTSYFLPPNFSLTYEPAEADFFLAFTRTNCDQRFRGKEIARVERFEVPLAIVKDLRPSRAHAHALGHRR